MPIYTRTPNTKLTLEEVLEPPWTATLRRRHRLEKESGVIFMDRSNTVHDAEAGYTWAPLNQQGSLGGRTLYKIVTANHPRSGQLLNAIDSPEVTFERTITRCRYLVLTVTYNMPASAPMSIGSSVAASAAAPGSRGASMASGQAARLKAAAELKAKAEAAGATAASLLAKE